MKLKKSNFLEGAFVATLCIIITKVMGVLYVIPFYKIIGERGGTLYGYAYNIYNIFLIISSAGIPLAISKLTSEYNTLGEHEKKVRMYQISARIIRVFSLLSFLICFLFAPHLARLIIGELKGGNTIEDVAFVIRTIAFALLVVPMLSIRRGYLQGHRYIHEPSISQIIEQVARIVIILGGSALCVYVFHLPLRFAVGVSVFAACLGGLASFLYLDIVVRKNKGAIGLDHNPLHNKETDREILRKIITYLIPFIVINLANTFYTFIDMILVIRTLPHLGFTAVKTEFVSSVFTTWGVKFNTIITSVSTGLIVSLIPNMVKDYTENNMEAVNRNFNKCLKIILLIVAPMAIFISGMAQSMWNLFYGPNPIGASVIRYSILVTILDCLYMVINSLLQSLNKRKLIYFSVVTGLVINLVLDIPFMHLSARLGLPAYHGAITATLLGFIVSNLISMVYLNRQMNLQYRETLSALPRFLLSAVVLIAILAVFRLVLPVSSPDKLTQLLIVAVAGIVSGGVYLLLNFRNIMSVLPPKISAKFTRGRFSEKAEPRD
ncbi:MAG: polysaccharide biosynthesis protein [Clostridia bacterium]|nr:polysaccharide biosynthesis protein [Clostridia bacterium]